MGDAVALRDLNGGAVEGDLPVVLLRPGGHQQQGVDAVEIQAVRDAEVNMPLPRRRRAATTHRRNAASAQLRQES
jgi:hypothetical protein